MSADSVPYILTCSGMYSLKQNMNRVILPLYLSLIITNTGTHSMSGWMKMQEMYDYVHPNLVVVLLFTHTKVE